MPVRLESIRLLEPACKRRRSAFVLAVIVTLSSVRTIPAQTTVTSVRENEFRSRWADYQVDRPPPTTAQTQETTAAEEPKGLLSAFGQSFNDHFRNGPLQLRADLSAGYEFTNESTLTRLHPDGSKTSPFISPAFGLFYNLELQAVTVSARYSLGYVYYLDQSYLAANHQGGILSQTAGLDLGYSGTRTTVRSATSGSYGNGSDIESGAFRDRLQISETLDAAYLVTDFTQVGAIGSLDYGTYTGGGVTDTENLGVNASLYGDYVITGKSRLRLELSAGDQHQVAGSASTSDRSYYQLQLRANYVPSAKLTFDAGLGVGYQQDSSVADPNTGFHPVYSIRARYVPTEKTSVSLRFGYEGVDIEPDLNFLVQWQPRPNTTFGLSVYQNSNFSTYVASQNLTSRGILATIQQKFVEKIEFNLSSGAEQTRGYAVTKTSGAAGSPGTYYFASVSLLWQFNSALALQSYYRGFSGDPGFSNLNQGWQSRASLSLRLTF